MKRGPNSPTGLSPLDKERRESTDSMASESTMVGANTRRSPSPSPTMRSNGTSSAMRRELNQDFSFGREKPGGAWRDLIIVDIWTIDGEDFKGTIKPTEAKGLIYQGALGLSRENLHGLKIEFRGHPVITFRLKTSINIDGEFHSDVFSYERLDTDGPKKIVGKIRGVRIPGRQPDEAFQHGEGKRVKIKNCNWSLRKEEITEWMELYGAVLVPLAEETHDLPDSDPDEEELGTGDYWITLKLEKPIPQFLPMRGMKIETYYRGQRQTCLNCYFQGHTRKTCKNPRREWIEYVIDFIKTHDYEIPFYGKWHEIAMKRMKDEKEEEIGENASDVDSPGIQEPEVIIDEATTETENLEEGPRAEGEEKEEKTVRRGRSQSIPNLERNARKTGTQVNLSGLKSETRKGKEGKNANDAAQSYRDSLTYKLNTQTEQTKSRKK